MLSCNNPSLFLQICNESTLGCTRVRCGRNLDRPLHRLTWQWRRRQKVKSFHLRQTSSLFQPPRVSLNWWRWGKRV